MSFFKYFCPVFVRKKKNKSGVVSIQIIDKSYRKYRVLKTIGSSSDADEIEKFYLQAKKWIKNYAGQMSLDLFDNKKQVFSDFISSVMLIIKLCIKPNSDRSCDSVRFYVCDI